jgi:hypothetical protein
MVGSIEWAECVTVTEWIEMMLATISQQRRSPCLNPRPQGGGDDAAQPSGNRRAESTSGEISEHSTA